MTRPVGTIQVDVDGLWVWQQMLGESMRLEPDELFDTAIPRFLDLFGQYGIKATFFVNGLDLEVASKRSMIRRIADRGHEIASHGYAHTYLTGIPRTGQLVEVAKSAALIERAVGRAPAGFRAPGFSVDDVTLELLHQSGYLYDSSVFSASLAGWVRLAYKLISAGRKMRNHRLSFSFQTPLDPYFPDAHNPYRRGGDSASPILEIPVTTVPPLRLPFHFSYTVLGGVPYFDWGLRQLQSRGLSVNFVFHLIDVVQPTHASIRNLIGVRMPLIKKLALVRRVLDALSGSYRLVTTQTFAEEMLGASAASERTHAVAAA